MTLEQMLATVRGQVTAKIVERNSHSEALIALRSDETPDETKIAEHRAAKTALDVELDGLELKAAELRAEIDADARADALAAQSAPVPGVQRQTAQVTVVSEARVYNEHNDRKGANFIRDFAASQIGDFAAQSRLARHMDEERVERAQYLQRDGTTSNFSGLVVPQYLVDLFAPLARAGRPLADNCRPMDLPPDGMTVTISRGTTGTTTAVQASENAGVSETDFDDTPLVVPVRTIAGQQDVSFQALARAVGTEAIILQDLLADYHTKLDNQIINGDGNTGNHLGMRNVVSVSTATLTDSSPTPAEAFGSLYAIQATIETAVPGKNVSFLVMHPRRWHWFRSAIGTDVTLVGQGSAYPPQALGIANNDVGYGAGVRGDLAGLRVIVDANIPTTVGGGTEDVILAVNASESFLWEDPAAPIYIKAEQPGAGNLMEKMVVYGYSAFTAGRYPAANGVISGSGLAAPTVFGKAIS